MCGFLWPSGSMDGCILQSTSTHLHVRMATVVRAIVQTRDAHAPCIREIHERGLPVQARTVSTWSIQCDEALFRCVGWPRRCIACLSIRTCIDTIGIGPMHPNSAIRRDTRSSRSAFTPPRPEGTVTGGERACILRPSSAPCSTPRTRGDVRHLVHVQRTRWVDLLPSPLREETPSTSRGRGKSPTLSRFVNSNEVNLDRTCCASRASRIAHFDDVASRARERKRCLRGGRRCFFLQSSLQVRRRGAGRKDGRQGAAKDAAGAPKTKKHEATRDESDARENQQRWCDEHGTVPTSGRTGKKNEPGSRPERNGTASAEKKKTPRATGRKPSFAEPPAPTVRFRVNDGDDTQCTGCEGEERKSHTDQDADAVPVPCSFLDWNNTNRHCDHHRLKMPGD